MAKPVKKTQSFGTSMGVSSIIAILVILILVVFSTLSIMTSKADLTLSQKTADGIAAFYEADSAAEDKIAEVAAVLESNVDVWPETEAIGDWSKLLQDAGYEITTETGGIGVAYTIPIDENRNLAVRLIVSEINGEIIRDLWQVVPARAWVAGPGPEADVFVPE